jgi:hypothetical protein
VATRPALFSILAFLGLVIGSSGAWVSIERARSLLASRDRFVAAARAAVDRDLPADLARRPSLRATDGGATDGGATDVTDGGAVVAAAAVETSLFPGMVMPSRDEVLRVVEKQADLVYSRRGVALPMAAMSFILSLLLFAGCARAMRGLAWGASAWSLAAVASLPYQILDAAFAVVQVHDLSTALDGMTTGAVMFAGARGSLQILFAVVKGALLAAYFVVCALYLRRPAIRALFTSSAN